MERSVLPRFLPAAVLAAAALAGCATYSPAPLSEGADRILAAPSARSGVIDLNAPLTPRALAAIAVIANPDLKAARAQAGVVEAQLFAAGLLPDPSFNFSYDGRISGPDPFNGLGAQLIYDLVALRDRDVVLAGARAAREQARLDLAWREWQTAGQARLLAARIAGLAVAAPLLDASRLVSSDALDRAMRSGSAGDLKADDLTARRLAAADAAERARQAARDLATARNDLNGLLGLPPRTVLDIMSDPQPKQQPAESTALFERARLNRLDLKALEAGYRSQEAAVRKAARDGFPSLQLTLSHTRDTADNKTFGPSVNFTLPVWNRNQGGVAQAKATRAQLQAEYAARLFATRSQIADLAAGLSIDQGRRVDLAAHVRPLDAAASAAEAAAARGDISRAAAEAARQIATDRRVALIALDQSIAEQAVALELAVGAPLESAATGAPAP